MARKNSRSLPISPLQLLLLLLLMLIRSNMMAISRCRRVPSYKQFIIFEGMLDSPSETALGANVHWR